MSAVGFKGMILLATQLGWWQMCLHHRANSTENMRPSVQEPNKNESGKEEAGP